MKTVQVSLRDSGQAHSLRELLLRDGVHQVHLVDQPDIAVAGVIVVDIDVIDIDRLERSGVLARGRERLVIVAPKASADLVRVYEAGVRHVVFHGDAPQTVRVAILATELTLASADL
jgi:hypothetical protein